jgi:iron-sulfur cluster insertion protein
VRAGDDRRFSAGLEHVRVAGISLQSFRTFSYVAAMNAQSPGFSVSSRAASRIAEIVAAEQRPAALRLSVLAGGCSGFQYRFALDRERQPDDIVIERDGAQVVIDPASLDLLGGAELDYADELMGAHFTVRNPNATASCGCGTSFSVE